jgi:hypothetical protein
MAMEKWKAQDASALPSPLGLLEHFQFCCRALLPSHPCAGKKAQGWGTEAPYTHAVKMLKRKYFRRRNAARRLHWPEQGEAMCISSGMHIAYQAERIILRPV